MSGVKDSWGNAVTLIDLFVSLLRLTWIFASLMAFPAWLVFLVFDFLHAQLERRRGAAPSPELLARRGRFRAIFWPAWMLIAGTGFFFALNDRGNARPAPAAVGLSWFLLGTFVILAVLLRLGYRRHPQFGSAKPKLAIAIMPPAWLRVLMIPVFIAIFYSFEPLGRRPGAPPTVGQIVAWGLSSFVAMMAIYIAVMVVYAFATRYDRTVHQAHKRTKEGDLDGAILELRGDVEARPPTANRLNGLGLLLLRREDWADAHDRFQQAIALDPRRPELRNNAAVALIELGRAPEAEAILSALAETYPRDPIIVQNHGRSLLALGRLDEAEARLIQAEAAMARGGPYRNKGMREQAVKALERNRGRLATAREAIVRDAR